MESFKQVQELISSKLSWDVFEKVLAEQNNCTNVNLIKTTLGEATKKGDSYLSTITRFSVEYSGDIKGINKVFTLHAIGKALLRNIAQRKTFRSYDFFKNEGSFYEKVWPQLDKFQKEVINEHFFQEIPNYLCGYFDGVNDYILMEDLSHQDYKSVNRSDALTFEKVKLVLKIFARFHALGCAFKEGKPDVYNKVFNEMKETYFHENYRTWYVNFQNNLKSIALEAVQKELPIEYATKFEAILKRDLYGETVKLCTQTPSSKFKTITHGDAWMPNFLTRYDELNQPLHSVMIDFQLSRYASIAQDLHLFIYACTDAELRAEYYEDMLKYYCQEFNKFYFHLDPNKDAGNSEEISFDDLLQELRDNGIFGICMSLEAVIMSMLDDNEVSDLEAIVGQDAVKLETVWIVKPLTDQNKRIRLAQVVKHMIDNRFI